MEAKATLDPELMVKAAWVEVESSNVRRLAVVPTVGPHGTGIPTSMFLVQFNDGSTWCYVDVPVALATAVVAAKSVGSAMHEFVIGKYDEVEIDA